MLFLTFHATKTLPHQKEDYMKIPQTYHSKSLLPSRHPLRRRRPQAQAEGLGMKRKRHSGGEIHHKNSFTASWTNEELLNQQRLRVGRGPSLATKRSNQGMDYQSGARITARLAPPT